MVNHFGVYFYKPFLSHLPPLPLEKVMKANVHFKITAFTKTMGLHRIDTRGLLQVRKPGKATKPLISFSFTDTQQGSFRRILSV